MLAFFLLCSCAHASGGAGGFLSRASWLKKSLLVPPVAFGILEAYSRAPPLIPPAEAPPPLLPPGAAPAPQDLVVVLPGAGGPDANTARIAAALRAPGGGREVVEYDWRPWKGDELRAPYDALRLGTRLGTELARRTDQPRSVHLVGVSVGAFVADAIAKSYATTAGAGLRGNRGGSDLGQPALRRPDRAPGCPELRPASTNHPLGLAARSPLCLPRPPPPGAGKANVHLTLCDAFTARGLAGLARPATAYGVATFGSSADYCESILNTDDPVPHTRRGDVPRLPLTPRLCPRTSDPNTAPAGRPSAARHSEGVGRRAWAQGTATASAAGAGRAAFSDATRRLWSPRSTATALRYAVTLDVTGAASRRDFVPLPGDSLHSWPAGWHAPMRKARPGPRPAWPGLTCDWPGLAEAPDGLRHDLAPTEASREPAGRRRSLSPPLELRTGTAPSARAHGPPCPGTGRAASCHVVQSCVCHESQETSRGPSQPSRSYCLLFWCLLLVFNAQYTNGQKNRVMWPSHWAGPTQDWCEENVLGI